MNIQKVVRGVLIIALMSFSAMNLTGCSTGDFQGILGNIMQVIQAIQGLADGISSIQNTDGAATDDANDDGSAVDSTDGATDTTQTSGQVEYYCAICGKTEMGDPNNPPSCCGKPMQKQSGSGSQVSDTNSGSTDTSSNSGGQVTFVCPKCGKTEVGDPNNPPTCCGMDMVAQGAAGTGSTKTVFAGDSEGDESDD